MRRPWPALVCSATGKKKYIYIYSFIFEFCLFTIIRVVVICVSLNDGVISSDCQSVYFFDQSNDHAVSVMEFLVHCTNIVMKKDAVMELCTYVR